MKTRNTVIITSNATSITSQYAITTPTVNITTNISTISTVIVPVVVVVVVLVVCLLVVCAIATIIILYQRAKHHHHQQDTIKNNLSIAPQPQPLPNPPPYNEQYNHTHHGNSTDIPTYDTLDKKETSADYTKIPCDDDGLYNRTHRQYNTTIQQLPPPIYSTLAEGGAPADYSVITETQDTGDGGMVYSAVVRKDGKKTTVKTTAHNEVLDDSQQQPAPDTSNEGLVYSAVVVKDGKKTTVKTTAQTSSTSDTVQPVDVIEGMVYSAVIRQDGKKTSVKVTVE